ncbi:MAG TPA: DUF192 domain-containing protein [Candidatus Saccharimonadales bacterium]|jgi:uncharacterized membrane protein (UPF0127 family)|nr:DUF192 domain-containing protein [Candidatus Saccharimonadales bacterium]
MLGRNSYRTLQLQSSRYTLQVADSAAERRKGLGGRSSIPTDAGMLFVYDAPGLPCFWMKDTRVALDMIWLDSNKKVVHIAADVTPGTYPKTFCPPQPAQYVIELRAGEAVRNHVQTGDRLSF